MVASSSFTVLLRWTLWLALCRSIESFAPRQPQTALKAHREMAQSRSLLDDTTDVITLAAPVASITSVSALAELLTHRQNANVQILNDVSHVSLDLASFLGPGALVLRLAAVIGRLCAVVRIHDSFAAQFHVSLNVRLFVILSGGGLPSRQDNAPRRDALSSFYAHHRGG